MPFGASHTIIRGIAKSALSSFFHEIRVINEDNVPTTGPVLIVCTHHNMIVDPAVLSTTFPHGRYIHYWAKSTLFANPALKALLLNAGNIPVNRRSKDNQSMFKGTFDVLALGEVVALFPEGTSYTEPRIMQVKDGAAWAALEYTKWAAGEQGRKQNAQPLSLVPAAIVYSNKSKYRSSAIIEYGKPIPLSELEAQFATENVEESKLAVKQLTKLVEQTLYRMTINANDWETLYAGTMARDLLYERAGSLNPDDFVTVSQLMVDLFTYPNPMQSTTALKTALLRYSSLLKASRLTNEALAALPLPRALDPDHPTPLPSRLSTLAFLIGSTIACLGPLPFFAIPLIINAPTYAISRYGAKMVEDEEETQAQNKIMFGMLLTATSYATIFCGVWLLFSRTPLGASLAAGVVWLLYTYYVRTIDDFYARAKQLLAAWRVLIGVWGPRRWDMNTATLKQYTVPIIPPPNPWIDKPLPSPINANGSTMSTAPSPAPTATLAPPAQPTLGKTPKRVASRSLVRHVLRARLEASRALAAFLGELERKSPRLRVSPHLGHPAGSIEEGYVSGLSSDTSDYLDAGAAMSSSASGRSSTPSTPSGTQPQKKAYLEGREIVAFLRSHRAMIAHESQDADWAAAASSDEGEGGHSGQDKKTLMDSDADEVVWVSPASPL